MNCHQLQIAELNLHSRQMAVIKEISSFGDVIVSGSMGDLFDSSNISNDCTQKTIIDICVKLPSLQARTC